MLQTFCKKLKVPCPDFEDSSGLTGDFGGVQVVWVDMKQEPYALVDTVIHEAVHVFQHFLAYIGESSIGKETQAYGIAYIATTLLKDLERQNALHEGWKTRLCEGEQALQQSPGTEESSLGTDNAPTGS